MFKEVDERMKSHYGHPSDSIQNIVELSGCTGTLLLVQEDFIVIANVGDSPVIMFRDLQEGEEGIKRFTAE